MARFFHLSDVHLTAAKRGWTCSQLFSKHATGWVNLTLLGRGKRFRLAEPMLRQFVSIAAAEQPDGIVFSGDATAIGFASEAATAAAQMRVTDFPGVAVPGNHDHYTSSAVRRENFERAFQPWLQGERLGPETYPFARQFGSTWLVCVNSALPNRGITDASGFVGAEQLHRLDQLLSNLPDGPRVLVTHYPLVKADGLAESAHHGLRDRLELAAVVRRHRIVAWLCGHRHQYYTFGPTDDVPFQLICAGSATMIGSPGFWDINVNDLGQVNATRRPLGA